ncbi:MAG TPA: hypothetical protein VKA00_00220 [Trueperaceae bacterium]|nr:hypothetical protein [Trueperaceae bacterium]
MRHLQRPARLIVPLLLALLPAVANAQSTAQHTVSVHIPTVLRLRIDQSAASDARAVDFTIDGESVTPDHLRIDVFANSSWTLSVEEAGGDGPRLEYAVDGSQAWATPSQRPVVTSGAATGGWRGYALGFRVHGQSYAGSHKRTLLFTLARP